MMWAQVNNQEGKDISGKPLDANNYIPFKWQEKILAAIQQKWKFKLDVSAAWCEHKLTIKRAKILQVKLLILTTTYPLSGRIELYLLVVIKEILHIHILYIEFST
jgi:HD-like signal output (HDOD) protein